MARINGIESTTQTSDSAFVAAARLDSVLEAIPCIVSLQDISDLQLELELAKEQASLLSEDPFEAEIAMVINVVYTRLGLSTNTPLV